MAPIKPRVSAEGVVTLVLVAGSVLLVLSQLSPGNLVSTSTPTGGDLGAHVWAGAYLKDHLLTHGRLTGWAPDWYAGFPVFVFYFVAPFLLMAVLSVVLPYVVAFKLVTVAGVLALPVVAYAFGRLARLAWPQPALLAAATLPFLFDQSYFILGGNIASTLAGEFAYSLALTAALLFLGVLLRGLETGQHRALAAGLLAAAILCHVYAALLAVGGGLFVVLARGDRRQVRWAAPIFMVGGAISAFWAVPFLLRLGYTTDMGWEKDFNYREMLLPFLVRRPEGSGTPVFIGVLVLAVVALVGAMRRRHRLPFLLAGIAAFAALGFVAVPQSRLYSSRLLPLWFLSLHLLAGLGLGELVRVAPRLGRRRKARQWPAVTATLLAFGAIVVAVGVPLRLVPGWLPLPHIEGGRPGIVQARDVDESYVPQWAADDFRGYEATPAWPEYRRLMRTMGRLPCGRALTEFSESLQRYGTTTGLMLLPYWTDGCIASMEGMFYESSATTPYHFITEAELSRTPSAPMRGLPYGSLDVERGVAHLRALGVRYYLTSSRAATRQATASTELRLVATSKPWRVWEVTRSAVVEPLENLPTVLTNVPKDGDGWLATAVTAFTGGAGHDTVFATSGPPSWPRAEVTWLDREGPTGDDVVLPPSPPVPTDRATVSHVRQSDEGISFDVDRVGSPVLVKMSYFPNWQASGARGPWRVTPNLMVVVPTSEHVSLHYGATPVDRLGWLVTALGLLGLVWLGRRAGRGAAGKVRGMADVRLYHNPGCSKSRGAVEILEEKGVDSEVIEYLKAPLTRADFEGILDILVEPPAELVRKDKKFAELGLNEADYQTREQVIDLLMEHPVLMQRPVVIRNGKAIIARPSEKVLELLD